ncbi:MAG: hypothetical protein KIH03_11005, partial [Paludibacteraceae bacterium]|nr:hypothetical protein [Paludibacteraceae bacterium]
DYSNKYKYASALWKIGLTFFLISILFLTPLIEIESTGHVDSDPFVLTYSYMFFEGGFRSIINSDFFAVQYIFAAASLFALFAVYHCNNLSYAGGEKLPILPILAFLIGIGIVFFLCEEPTYKTRIIPLYNKKIVEIIYLRINWMDYWVWMISLLCILSSSLLQCSIKHDEAETLIKAQNEKLTKNENNSFFSKLLGGTPDTLQKIFICLMFLSLIPWFIMTCIIVIIKSDYGFDYYFKDWITILYPITTFLLMKLMFRMSVRWKKRWIFYLVPLVGILLKDISLIF